MPSLGADMEAGRLVEWLVKPGDHVARGDIVAVVETQKGAIEIEIFQEGTVHALSAPLGTDLAVGAPLAIVLAEGEAPPAEASAAPAAAPAPAPVPASAPASAPASVAASVAVAGPAGAPPPSAAATPEPAPAVLPPTTGGLRPDGAVVASPAARVRARDLGVELAGLNGTGPGGLIVLADVEAQPPGRAAPPPPKPRTPMEEMRHAIAAAMTRSKQTIPHFYLSETIDVQPSIEFLERRNADRPPAERILLVALLAVATARAAAQVKTLNGRFAEGGFEPSAEVNTGIAVALRGGGLVAPCLHDAVGLTLDQTMAGIRDLVTRARAGRLRSSEMKEGTITLSSLGETGAEAMTGVIFPPQVALVGVGAPHLRPWLHDGVVVPRHVVTLTVSADHRVSDGREVAKFIAAFETLLQTPETL